jgi:SAM-dependent methyltransferase
LSLRFHEISERNLRILDPFLAPQIESLAQKCQVKAGLRQLDLACGKGELLCQWAKNYGIHGTGVDISEYFIECAQDRRAEFGLEAQVEFVHGDAIHYPFEPNGYDIVSCLGATWIGGNFAGTIELLKPALRNRDSLMVLGEPFWQGNPPDAAYEIYDPQRSTFTTLGGLLQVIEQAGFELIDMELASLAGWDYYMTSQWHSISDWLRENPEDPDAQALREWNNKNRRDYRKPQEDRRL